jgi:predicted metal-dependent enzyme (double-stranded beta helix superfamily)
MYLWGPGEHDPIHDHNSWGVIGTISDGLEVIDYRRLDDGTSDLHASIEESGRIVIGRGETSAVLPMNEGIHRTGNAGESTIAQVAVYGGNQTGRNYVHTYDAQTGRISRLYSQQNKKRMLALDALRGL